MIKDKYIFEKIGLLSILVISLLLLFKHYHYLFSIKLQIILILALIIFSFGLFINNKISFLGYLISLYAVLLLREHTDNNYSDNFYLDIWLKNLFSNKIIFINVFGNLILYIPFVYYLNTKYKYILVFCLIIAGEYVQYLLNVGVFDVVDIIINILGIFLYMIVYEVFIWMKKKKI